MTPSVRLGPPFLNSAIAEVDDVDGAVLGNRHGHDEVEFAVAATGLEVMVRLKRRAGQIK